MKARVAVPIIGETGTPPRRTAEGDRGDRKAQASDLIRAIRIAAGLSEQALADHAGLTRAHVRGMEDPVDYDHPPHLDVAMAPQMLPHAVRALAELGGMVAVALPRVEAGASDIRTATEMQRECSEVVSTFLEVISDGRRTGVENALVRKQAWEAVESLVRLIVTIDATDEGRDR